MAAPQESTPTSTFVHPAHALDVSGFAHTPNINGSGDASVIAPHNVTASSASSTAAFPGKGIGLGFSFSMSATAFRLDTGSVVGVGAINR